MTSTARRNGPRALQLSPFSRRDVERPSVVIVILAITTTESAKHYDEQRANLRGTYIMIRFSVDTET